MSASLYSASHHRTPPHSDRNVATNIQEPAHTLLAKLHLRNQLSSPIDVVNYTVLFERLHPAYENDYIDRIQILGTYASAFTPGLWTRILNQLQLTRLNTFECMHLDIAIILSAALRVFIQQDKESIPESEFLQPVHVRDYLYPIHMRSTYSEPRYLDPVLTHFVRKARYYQTTQEPTQYPVANNSPLSASPNRPASHPPSSNLVPALDTFPLAQIPGNCSSPSSNITPSPSPSCAVAISSPSHERCEGINIIFSKDPAITSTMSTLSSFPPHHSLRNLSLTAIASLEAPSPVPPFVPPDSPAAIILPSNIAGPTPASAISIIKNSSVLAADPSDLNSHSDSCTPESIPATPRTNSSVPNVQYSTAHYADLSHQPLSASPSPSHSFGIPHQQSKPLYSKQPRQSSHCSHRLHSVSTGTVHRSCPQHSQTPHHRPRI